MVIKIGWMVLEIWEGGNPPNWAHSLGIESLEYFTILLLDRYYTEPANSADSTDFTGPEKTHSSVLKAATGFGSFPVLSFN